MRAKIALVTGASSGIGYEAALELKKKGFIVYGAARRIDKLKKLKYDGIEIIKLDVTEEESMKTCIKDIVEKEGHIDVLVNNAGYGSYGAIEEVSMEEARRQVEVNLFGLARMIQLVIPHMRKDRSGRIINIASMGGKIHSPFGGWYHATKFAVEGFSDCLRMELEEFGIDVILVEPGGIKTEWGIIAAENLKKTSAGGVYYHRTNKLSDNMKKTYVGNSLTDPNVIGKIIAKAAVSRRPKTRYLLGSKAKVTVLMRRLLTDRTYDKIMKKILIQ